MVKTGQIWKWEHHPNNRNYDGAKFKITGLRREDGQWNIQYNRKEKSYWPTDVIQKKATLCKNHQFQSLYNKLL